MGTLSGDLEKTVNNKTPIGAKEPKIRLLGDVLKQGNYSLEDIPTYQSDISTKVSAGFQRAAHEAGNTFKGAVEIWGGQAALSIGGIAGSETVESFGRSLIKSAYDEIESKDKEFMQKAIQLRPEEYDDFSTALGGGLFNYGGMLAVGYLTGGIGSIAGLSTKAKGAVTAAGGIGSMFALELSGKAQDKLNTYIEKSGDVDFKDYTADIASKDFMFSAMYAAGSAILEKKFGFGEQVKLFKMPFGEKLKNIARVALSEGGTEFVQSLYETGVDLAGGYIEFSKLPQQFKQALQEGAIGAVLGGGAGIAAAVNHRSQAKQILKENLQNTIPEKDIENVVDAIYEESDGTMRSVMAQELIQSEELRNKHGNLYNQIRDKIDLQSKIVGAFEGASEATKAQYLTSTANMLADQVLAEANRRNETIDDVIKASDVRLVDGKFYWTPLTQSEIKVNKEIQKIKKKRNYNPEKMSLLAYLKYNGGLKDVGGDLKAMDAGKQMIGLINNKKGRSLDDAALDAWESGYFPEFTERPTVNDLLNAISESLGGKRIYREKYRKTIENKKAKQEAGDNESRLDSFLSAFLPQEEIEQMSLNDKQKYYDDIQQQSREISEDEYVQQEIESLNEDEAERYAIMRENDVSHEDAMTEITRNRLLQQEDERIAWLREVEDFINKLDSGEITKEQKVRTTDKELEKKAKKHFGTTYNINEAGYILTDGSMLDFSGKREGGQAGNRAYDHRDISQAFEETGFDVNMEDFVNNGAIRYMPETNSFYIANLPTSQQLKVISNIVDKTNGEVNIELVDDAKNMGMAGSGFYKEFESGSTIKNIKNAINAYYSGNLSKLQEFYQIKNLPKQKGKIKGAFDALTKSIEITSEADFSTYQHEFAHFWLDNMWEYVQSGKASESYKKQFEELKNWLGVKPNQKYYTREQTEKFARGYEKFLFEGKFPNPIIGSVFDDYREFIKDVYESAQDIDLRAGEEYEPLSEEARNFFNIMITGKTQEQIAEIEEKPISKEEKPQEKETAEKPKETKETRERGLSKTTSEMAKQQGIDVEVPTYEKRSSTEMGKKADELIQQDKQLAIDIVKGLKPEQDGIYRQDLYAALRELALNEGDSDLLNELSRSMTVEEATELGQRIQALARGRIDPVKQMVELRDERMKKNKVTKTKIKEETEKATKQINKEIAESATPKEWEEFIKSLEC